MGWLLVIGGVLLMWTILRDTFEAMILPRTVTRNLRPTRLFYACLRTGLKLLLKTGIRGEARETLLASYAPLSLLLLIVFWAVGLIFAFALIHSGLQTPMNGVTVSPIPFADNLYFSGVTFLTLGYGDFSPKFGLGRFLATVEAGTGFLFLAVVISYLPVLYQSFSRREVTISMLDARAGSPPTAGELLRRFGEADNADGLLDLLKEWEHSAAELLESVLSYPILAFYRSQHDRQSWIGAFAAILDVSALLRIETPCKQELRGRLRWQAQLTFAMARHALVDLSMVLFSPPKYATPDRFPFEEWLVFCERTNASGIYIDPSRENYDKLAVMRHTYEPYLASLSNVLNAELPPWIILEKDGGDNWEHSAYDKHTHFVHEEKV